MKICQYDGGSHLDVFVTITMYSQEHKHLSLKQLFVHNDYVSTITVQYFNSHTINETVLND